MTTNLSISAVSNNYQNKSFPSFGMAKLSSVGREAADSFGYTANTFLEPEMYKKQGVFKKSFLTEKLAEGQNFADICVAYGCTNNSKANTAFIENQILSKKSAAALARVEEEQLKNGLMELYKHNYDNPTLSTANTSKLLVMMEGIMPSDEYIRNAGILKVGVEKK